MSGTIRLAGRDITKLSADERRRIRGARIGMIFQEPATALDPVYTVGRQITETIMAHEISSLSGPKPGPLSCWNWSLFQTRRAASIHFHTNCRGGCANAR